MAHKKYFYISTLIIAALILPSCDWNSCKRQEDQEIAEQAQKAQDVAQAQAEMATEEQPAQKAAVQKKQGGVTEIRNKQDFDALLEENEQVIAKFYSDTCPPCKASKPVFEELSHAHPDIAFVAVNAAHRGNDPLFDRYNVDEYPTFVFIESGKVASREVGYKKKERLENKVDSFAQK